MSEVTIRFTIPEDEYLTSRLAEALMEDLEYERRNTDLELDEIQMLGGRVLYLENSEEYRVLLAPGASFELDLRLGGDSYDNLESRLQKLGVPYNTQWGHDEDDYDNDSDHQAGYTIFRAGEGAAPIHTYYNNDDKDDVAIDAGRLRALINDNDDDADIADKLKALVDRNAPIIPELPEPALVSEIDVRTKLNEMEASAIEDDQPEDDEDDDDDDEDGCTDDECTNDDCDGSEHIYEPEEESATFVIMDDGTPLREVEPGYAEFKAELERAS